MEKAVEKEAHGRKGKIKDSYSEMPLHHSSMTLFYFTLPMQVFFFLMLHFKLGFFALKKKSGMQFRDKQNANK